MALAPLFADSLEQVERALRLHNLDGGSPSSELVLDAIRGARTIFWGELGSARIAEIQATTYTDSPSTDAEHLRMIARMTEFDLVRYCLAAHMPVGFRSGKAEFMDSRQIEGNFKRLSVGQTASLRNLWWSDQAHGIKVRLAYLNGDIEPGREPRVVLREIDDDDYATLRNVTLYGSLDEIPLSSILI